jgi:endoglucanase
VDAQGHLDHHPGYDTHFGWEAVRLPWRLALDRLWFRERRGSELLRERFLPFFKQAWHRHGHLAAVYHYDGRPEADFDSPVLYAGVLAAALACDDQEFASALAQKILSFCRQAGGQTFFVSPEHYYVNNWAWLGLALYAGWVKPF